MQMGSPDSYVTLLGSLGANIAYSNDINDLCRLCARRCIDDPGCYFDIESGKKQLLHMIKTCLPIDIDTSDPYPKKICLECKNYLNLIFQFHNTAIKAQEIFKLRLPDSHTSNPNLKIPGSKQTNRNRVKKTSTKRKVSEAVDLLAEMRTMSDQVADDVSDGAAELLEEIGDIRNKRGFSKRCVWSTEEKAVMMKHFSSYMMNGTLPSFHLCSMVRQLNPILRNRSNSIMKAWVYNQQKRQRERNKWSFDAHLTISGESL